MSLELTIQLKKVHKDAKFPKYATEGSACVDLYTVEPLTLMAKVQTIVRTGIAVAFPEGYMGLISPRSGLTRKYGVIIANSPGIIDSDYREEIFILMSALSNIPVSFGAGERIAQMAIVPVQWVKFELVEELDKTGRTGGFGSTGMR